MAQPELFGVDPARVQVELAGQLTAGMTVTDFGVPGEVDGGNARVAMRIDVDNFWEVTLGAYARVADGHGPLAGWASAGAWWPAWASWAGYASGGVAALCVAGPAAEIGSPPMSGATDTSRSPPPPVPATARACRVLAASSLAIRTQSSRRSRNKHTRISTLNL